MCGKEYKYSSSVSNLQKHLRISHTDAWKGVESAKTTTKPITPWVVTKGNSHYTWLLICTKAKSIMGLFVYRFVDWLTTSGRPLSIVNDPGFQGRPTFLDWDSRCLQSSDSRIDCRITCEEATPAGWQKELGRLAANSACRGTHACGCTDREGTDRASTMNRQ